MDLERFNRELLTIGGRRNGKPRLRCVSAATEMKFACGGMKIKYPTASKTEERWLWGLKDKTTGQVTAKSEDNVKANADPNLYAVRKLLGRKVTWIGRPNYVVEYFRGPDEMKDTEVNWFQNRYGWWKNPESRLMEWTDINGEFPHEGRYDHLFTIKVDDGTLWGKFKEPDEDDLAEARRIVAVHAAFRKVNTDEEMIQQMIDKRIAREDQAEAELADNIEQVIGADWRRMLANNPRVFQSGGDPAKMNKMTNHGRAK